MAEKECATTLPEVDEFRKTSTDTRKGMVGPEDYATLRKWRYLEIRLFRALREARAMESCRPIDRTRIYKKAMPQEMPRLLRCFSDSLDCFLELVFRSSIHESHVAFAILAECGSGNGEDPGFVE